MEGRGSVSRAFDEESDEEDSSIRVRIASEYAPALRAALETLPPSQRLVLEADAACRPRSEVARELNISAAALERERNAGLAALRIALVPTRERNAPLSTPCNDNALETSPMPTSPITRTAASLSNTTSPANDVSLTLTESDSVTAVAPPEAQPFNLSRKKKGAASPATTGASHCTEHGCGKPVGKASPSHASLADYCTTHRRLHAFRINRASHDAIPPTRRVPVIEIEPALDEASALVRAGFEGEPIRTRITPALAAALLKRNASNRAIAQERADQYARDIIAGNWHVNNQGIALGADGTLYDGQHRLLAIVKANVPVETLVVRGLPPEARPTIDQGRARSVGDTLRMLDGIANGPRVAAYIRAIWVLKSRRNASLSHAEVCAAIQHYAPALDWLSNRGPKGRPYNKAAAVGALLYAYAATPEHVESFARGYVSGTHLEEGSPILTFRNYLLEPARAGRDQERVVALKTLRCLAAHVRGERFELLRMTEEGFEYFEALYARTERRVA